MKGTRIAVNVGAMLIGFIALIAVLDVGLNFTRSVVPTVEQEFRAVTLRGCLIPLLEELAIEFGGPSVVAIGGGGFGRDPYDPRLDDYLLSLVEPQRPKIAFLAQATGMLLGEGTSVERLAAYEFHRSDVNRTGRPPSRVPVSRTGSPPSDG